MRLYYPVDDRAARLNLHAVASRAADDRAAYAVTIPAAMNAFLCAQATGTRA